MDISNTSERYRSGGRSGESVLAGCMISICLTALAVVVESASLALLGIVLFYVVSIYHSARKFGIVSPTAIFLITSSPYVLASPLDRVLFGSSRGYEVWAVTTLSVASLVFLTSFFAVSCAKAPTNLSDRWYIKPKVTFSLFLIITAAVVSSYLLYLHKHFGVFGGLTRGEIYLRKSASFEIARLAGYVWLIASAWFALTLKSVSNRQLFVFALLSLSYVMADILVLGDRRIPVLYMLSVAYLFSQRHSIRTSHLVIGAILAFALLVYGYVRNTPTYNWAYIAASIEYASVLNPAAMEFGYYPLIWEKALEGGWTFHPSYLEIPLQLVPSSLFPNRPEAPSIWFVRTEFPELFANGGGVAFNAVLESILNFHVAGPVLAGVFIGGVYRCAGRGSSELSVLINALVIFSFSFMLRNDMVSVVRYLLVSLVVVGALLVLLFSINRKATAL